MRPKWNNIATALLLIAGLVLLVRYRRPIYEFLAAVDDIGPGYTPDEQVRGMIALGFACACLLAFVKIVLRDREK